MSIWLVFMSAAIYASALPDDRSGIMLVVFHPGTSGASTFANIIQAGGNPVRRAGLDFIWTVQSNSAGFVGRLKRQGAIVALEEFPFSPQLAGCFAFSQKLRTPLALNRLSP